MLMPDHAAKLTDLPDDQMGDILPMAKKLATASGVENYNILQVCSAAQVADCSQTGCSAAQVAEIFHVFHGVPPSKTLH